MRAGEAIAKKFYFVSKIKLFWGKSRLPHGQAGWVIPSAGNREDSATETYRLILCLSMVRVQGCGKSAPATLRSVG